MNPSDQLSNHFTYKEGLWLPQWSRMANASDGLNDEVLSNLKTLFTKMDLVREWVNSPIIVHVTYRPLEYNKLIGGAANSAHVYGMACDFNVANILCDAVRDMIVQHNKLEEWGMRMEKLPGSNWVHLDTREPLPGHNRYFVP